MTDPTMHAVDVHEFGSPDVLRYEDAARPTPGPGEVLLRVAAAGINPPDWYFREGMPGVPPELLPPFQLPAILGTDASGVVVELGEGVDRFEVGDEAFGMLRFPAQIQAGTYAQYVTAPATDLAHKPHGVDDIAAAATPMAALTAWQYVIEAGHDHGSPFQEHDHVPVSIDSSTTVLVNGAAGGVGHFVVQLAKWKGAKVIAVASGSHEQFLRDLGADEFIDYTKTPPEDVAHDVDLVVDTLGGPTSGRFLKVLKPGGALYPVYFAEYDPDEVARAGVTTSVTQVRSNGDQLEQIGTLMDEGVLTVAIDSTYPLADAKQAHERAAQGHLQGKLVLTVPAD